MIDFYRPPKPESLDQTIDRLYRDGLLAPSFPRERAKHVIGYCLSHHALPVTCDVPMPITKVSYMSSADASKTQRTARGTIIDES